MRMFEYYHDIIINKLNDDKSEISIECSGGVIKFDIERKSDFIIQLSSDDGIIIKYHTNKLKITRVICKNPKKDDVIQMMWLMCITLSGGWM